MKDCYIITLQSASATLGEQARDGGLCYEEGMGGTI